MFYQNKGLNVYVILDMLQQKQDVCLNVRFFGMFILKINFIK